jgi:hypothetical protein
MFHLLQTYVAFKCLILQVFRVLEICLEIHAGMTQTLGEGARWASGRQMVRTALLGSCRGCSFSSGLLGPSHEERGGGQGKGVTVAEPPKWYGPHVLVIVLKISNNHTCVPQNLRSVSGVLGKPESSTFYNSHRINKGVTTIIVQKNNTRFTNHD